MRDEPDGATATVTPLPTMMPGAPQYRAPTRKELQRELIRDVRLSGRADPSASTNGGRQQLTAAQTTRHLATQHALTFNRDEDLTLEELLADAAVIERYIADGIRDEPEPETQPETGAEPHLDAE
jgi:hypothetical protein